MKINEPFETTHTGFWMTFENGYAISVQWGSANYCTNRSFDNPNKGMVGAARVSNTAEVAIMEPNGSFHKFEGGDMCQGHCSPEEVYDLMTYCRNL